MAFTEFYVTQHADAHEYNGGSGTGASKTGTVSATITAGSNPYTLTIASGTWPVNIESGDWGLFDCDNATVTSRYSFLVVSRDSDTALTIQCPTALSGTENVRIGGAWSGVGSAAAAINQWGSTKWLAAGITNAPRVNVQYNEASPYSGESFGFATNTWAVQCSVVVEAYETSPGDLDWRTTNKRAVIVSGSTYGLSITSVAHYFIRNLHFVMGTGEVTGVYANSTGVYCYNCVVSSSSVGSQTGFSGIVANHFIRCLAIKQATGYSFTSSIASHCTAYACNNGFTVTAYASLQNCLAYDCAVSGFYMSGVTSTYIGLVNCISDGNLVGFGHGGTAQAARVLAQNCSFTNNTTGVTSLGGANQGFFYYIGCNFYGNTADFDATMTTSSVDLGGSVSVPPGYVDANNGDFRIASTSAMKGAGSPQGILATVDGGTVFSAPQSLDIGALQRAEPTIPAASNIKKGVTIGDVTGTQSFVLVGNQ